MGPPFSAGGPRPPRTGSGTGPSWRQTAAEPETAARREASPPEVPKNVRAPQDAAVIRGEDHQRPPCQPEPTDCVEHPADPGVHVLDQRHESRTLRRDAWLHEQPRSDRSHGVPRHRMRSRSDDAPLGIERLDQAPRWGARSFLSSRRVEVVRASSSVWSCGRHTLLLRGQSVTDRRPASVSSAADDPRNPPRSVAARQGSAASTRPASRDAPAGPRGSAALRGRPGGRRAPRSPPA